MARQRNPAKNPSSQRDSGRGKTKKISKEVQNRPKPTDELNRIAKSREEKIYIIQIHRKLDEKEWVFILQGLHGKIYRTRVSTRLCCNCLDFRYRGKPCKHHYFLITRILKNDQLLDLFKSNYNITKNAFQILDMCLWETLKEKMKQLKTEEVIDLRDETQCIFCFGELENNLSSCKTCYKYFHRDCIEEWKNKNPTCPLCRQPLAGNDPFGTIKTIEI